PPPPRVRPKGWSICNPARRRKSARRAARPGLTSRPVRTFGSTPEKIKAIDDALGTVYPKTLEDEPYNRETQLTALGKLMRVEALIQAADDYLFEYSRQAYKDGVPVAKIALVTGKSRSTINLWVNRNRRGHA